MHMILNNPNRKQCEFACQEMRNSQFMSMRIDQNRMVNHQPILVTKPVLINPVQRTTLIHPEYYLRQDAVNMITHNSKPTTTHSKFAPEDHLHQLRNHCKYYPSLDGYTPNLHQNQISYPATYNGYSHMSTNAYPQLCYYNYPVQIGAQHLGNNHPIMLVPQIAPKTPGVFINTPNTFFQYHENRDGRAKEKEEDSFNAFTFDNENENDGESTGSQTVLMPSLKLKQALNSETLSSKNKKNKKKKKVMVLKYEDLIEPKNDFNLLNIIKDQSCCRQLQNILEKYPELANKIIFPGIKESLKEVLLDKFGNYLFQKLISLLSQPNIDYIYSSVSFIFIIS